MQMGVCTVYLEIFASGNFDKNEDMMVCNFFTKSYFRYNTVFTPHREVSEVMWGEVAHFLH